MYYDYHSTVHVNDTDVNGIASASHVLRYMQEAADLQLRDYGPSGDTLRKDGLAFILSRFSMCLYRPLYAYDPIIATTWACPSRGASFERCSRLMRGDDLISELYTVWALVHIEDRSLCHVEDISFGFSPEEPLAFDAPKRVHLPRGLELPLIGERTVVYSDLDVNRHMNNTNYPDMLCNYIPGGMPGRRVVRMAIHFMNEAQAGDSLRIYGAEYDSSTFFRTVGRNGTGVEAEFVTDIID